jgi:alanine dehydrogenase
MLPYLLAIARDGVEGALENCPDLARGIYTLRGRRP